MLKKYLAILLGIIIITFILLSMAVNNPYMQNIAKKWANEKLYQYQETEVQFGAISISVMPPRLLLYNAEISTHGKPLISINQMSIGLSYWDIFLGKRRLSKVSVTGISLNEGKISALTEYIKGFSSPEPGSSHPHEAEDPIYPPNFELPFQTIEIIDSFVDYSVNSGPENLRINTGIRHLNIYMQNWWSGVLKLNMNNTTIVRNEKVITNLNAVNILGDLSQEKIDLERIQINGDHFATSGKGLISIKMEDDDDTLFQTMAKIANLQKRKVFSGIRSQLNLSSQFDLDLLHKLFDLKDTKGLISTSSLIKFNYDMSSSSSYEVIGNIKSEGAKISGFSLEESQSKFEIKNRIISLDDIELRSQGEVLATGKGNVDLTDDKIPMKFEVSPLNVGLKRLLGILSVENFDIFDMNLFSERLSIYVEANPFFMTVTGDATYSNISIPQLTSQPFHKQDLSPRCTGYTDLHINGERLNIIPTTLQCESNNRAKIKGSKKSPLKIAGPIYFTDKGLDLKFSGQQDLELLYYFSGIKGMGQADINAQIGGPYDEILIEFSVNADNLGLFEIPIKKLTLQGNLKGKKLFLQEFNLIEQKENKSNGFVSIINSTMHLEGAYPFEVYFNIKKLSSQLIKDLLASYNVEFLPVFSIDDSKGFIKSNVSKILAGEAEVNVTASNFGYDKELIAEFVNFTITSKSGNWQLSNGFIRKKNISLSAKLNHQAKRNTVNCKVKTLCDLGLNGDDHIFINVASDDSTALNINRISDFPFIGKIFKKLDFDSKLKFRMNIHGPILELQGSASAELSNIQFKGMKLANIYITSFLQNNQLENLVSYHGETLKGKISIDLTKKSLPYKWYFLLDQLDVRFLGSQFFSQDARNFAYLSGTWEFKGLLTDWWNSTGRIEISQFWAKLHNKDLMQDNRSFSLNLNEPVNLIAGPQGWNTLSGKNLTLVSDIAQFDISFDKFRPPEKMDLSLKSIIDLKILKSLPYSLEKSQGKLLLLASLTGSVDSPQFNMKLKNVEKTAINANTYQPLTFGSSHFRPPLENINIDMELQNNVLEIKRLTAKKGDGNLNLSGKVIFLENGNIENNLQLNFNRIRMIFPIAVLKSFDTEISGSLVVSGSKYPYDCRGDIIVNKGYSRRDFDIRDEIINALKKKRYNITENFEKHYLNLNINLLADDSINISNLNLQAIISTDLNISGNEKKPLVKGTIATNRGKIIYKRDFKISRGLFNFEEEYRNDPSLSLLATADISSYRVNLIVSGRLSAPIIDLTVDPPTRPNGTNISKSEILSLISKGRLPASNSTTQETGDTVSNEAFNIVLSQFEEPLEKFLGIFGGSLIGQPSMESFIFEDGTQGVRVNVPLEVSEKWDVVYRRDTSFTNSSLTKNSVSSEYYVNESILFQSEVNHAQAKSQDDQVGGSVDLQFRFAFP